MISISENNGIAILSDDDQQIYSVGISTGGLAEIRMVQSDRKRHVIATTLDSEGAKYAKNRIEASEFSDQIEVKVEDVSQPLPYLDCHFDFIYARLVLHYLPRCELMRALNQLHRVLRVGGKIFVVVRSVECPEARSENAIPDPDTGTTTYTSNGYSYSRYFHSEESIQNYLRSSGFFVKYAKSYEEQLCIDFRRTQLSSQVDVLIELLAVK